MKFRLELKKQPEEEIVAYVNEVTPLIEELREIAEGQSQLCGYTEDEIVHLDYGEIECIYAEGGKTYVAYGDGNRYRLRQRLSHLEPSLPSNFVRINKSAIANRAKIKRFTTEIIGAVDVEFLHGYTDYVSRRCFADLRKRYDL